MLKLSNLKRIDDAYARVGRRKRITSTSELKDVLESIWNVRNILR